jgi:integrase
MSDLGPRENSDLTRRERDLRHRARDLYESQLSENTRRAYRSGWDDFLAFCESKDRRPLPASKETVALYAAKLSESLSVSTVEQRLSAIKWFHEQSGHESPTASNRVRGLVKGLARKQSSRKDQARPLLTKHIAEITDALQEETESEADRLRQARDRALILLGYAGALRRSELANVRLGHLHDRDRGFALEIPQSKTDPEGTGQIVGIVRTGSERCPCDAVEEWIFKSGITEGPLFRGVHRSGALLEDAISARTVNNVIKRSAQAAGFSTELQSSISGHSLRAGHITQATINNVPDGVIRAQSRHEDKSTFYGYQRIEKALKRTSSARLGL